MNGLDIFIGISLVIGAAAGLKKGLVGMVLPLLGILVGLALAGRFYGSLAERLFSSQGDTARIIAFVIILLVVFVAASIAAGLISKALSLAFLGWVNGLLGAILGVLLGVVTWGAVLTALVRFIPFAPDSFLRGSFLAGLIVDRFPLILALLPPDFDRVRDFFR